MKRNVIILAIALLAVFAATSASAQEHKFGLGIVLGAPTGISGKVFLSQSNALDFDVAWDFVHDGFAGTLDYLYHFNNVLNSSVVTMRPYIGGGGQVGIREDPDPPHDKHDDPDHVFGLAGRFTGGLSFMFIKAPVELFLDASPGIWLVPGTDFYFAGVIGARYFF